MRIYLDVYNELKESLPWMDEMELRKLAYNNWKEANKEQPVIKVEAPKIMRKKCKPKKQGFIRCLLKLAASSFINHQNGVALGFAREERLGMFLSAVLVEEEEVLDILRHLGCFVLFVQRKRLVDMAHHT